MLTRCRWVTSGLLLQELIDYHDHEYSRPLHDEQQAFAYLCLELFQSGLSWQTILKKRSALQEDFFDFDIERVAAMRPVDVERLMADPRIIRNRRKIEAVIQNARVLMDWHRQNQQLIDWLWHFTDNQSIDIGPKAGEKLLASTNLSKVISTELKQAGFSFTGPVVVESFLQAVGIHNGHNQDCDWHDLMN
ncbi:DNA-3-methyladenine glycosylase I [Fructobacillus parabroussonetiae]|uniref:DNA-3-methyladenine glycosylase I n=1 Tax=Fructobacillus parabroussonetiae TaxID=2713174 RepID=A0ABS5QZH0_9LACO|nr:DNA-3-methyladenine glycosylase I [Fructobacillus parabroussonetiae]MBS9337302.1 DNA-3-methyladenine glycosylase I [Fructobacillus parabroussonetiae]MCK8617764.1 DNA-3-methyladenine glycosylase I [Fructobacillus parabroussonetiae]